MKNITEQQIQDITATLLNIKIEGKYYVGIIELLKNLPNADNKKEDKK